MLSVEVLRDADALLPLESQWDDLATALRAPYCAPVWMLSWWRHFAPAGCALRVVSVREGDDLVGVAPFFSERRGRLTRYRLLAAPVSFPVQPLAVPGHEQIVAQSVADALRGTHPRPDLLALEGTPAATPWAGLLARAWRGDARARVHRVRALPAPALVLRGRSYEEWLSSKSANFRQQMGRFRRRLQRKGATFRLASGADEVEQGLKAFVTLHHARWKARGGSNVLRPGMDDMLRAVAARFAGSLRFRLWLLDVAGKTISAQIFVGAGGELAYWNGGFDEDWEAERPAIQTIMAVIEHAWEVGDDRVSLGGGIEEYKYRFADEDAEEVLDWTTLVPMTAKYPLARLSLVPDDLRRTVANRLSAHTKQRLKQLLAGRRPAGTTEK